ncbi:14565_t:CDS:2, partial [Acaulospora colombiana]
SSSAPIAEVGVSIPVVVVKIKTWTPPADQERGLFQSSNQDLPAVDIVCHSSLLSDAMKRNTANLNPSSSGNPSFKSRSGSSDLSDLSTDSGGIPRISSMQSSPSDNRFPMDDPDDIDYDSMESSEYDVPLTTSKRVPSREDRPKFRNLLNTKLEQMFSEKGIPLTPYGRIPWTTLGETLAEKGFYITG